jgi:hypothetical protein
MGDQPVPQPAVAELRSGVWGEWNDLGSVQGRGTSTLRGVSVVLE